MMKACLVVLFLFAILYSAESRCAFSQNCTDPMNPKSCGVPFAVDIEEFETKEWSAGPACPSLMKPGAKLCCNDGQNTMVKQQLNSLTAAFGSIGGDGGCDNCAANLMRYWCHYTCDPNQADYMSVIGYANYTDPFSKKNKTILQMNYTNTFETACQIYESCKTTAYVSQMTAMQSAQGLLNVQGMNAPSQGPTQMFMQYTMDKTKGIFLDNMNKCNEVYSTVDKWGYPIYQNCSCNSCEQMCAADFDYKSSLPGELDGLDLSLVLFLYAFIVVFALICQFVVRKPAQEKDQEEEQQGEYIRTAA